MDANIDNIVLQKWQDLEKKWLELNPAAQAAAKVEQDQSAADLKTKLWRGHNPISVYEIPGSYTHAWEVKYGEIQVMYFGIDAEERAREFAKSLLEDDGRIEGNVRAAQEFLESCENWKDYNSEENRIKFSTALLLVRPLTVDKIWAVFRKMIDAKELLPVS